MRDRCAILAAVAALMLLAPASASAASLVPLAPAHSFSSDPVFATSPPGDPRVFIVERAGGIRIVENGKLLPTPFLTVPNVDTEVERGLLSMAFAPDYATSGLFYVFTVAAEPDELEPSAEPGQIRIVEYRRSASDPNLADPASARLVFDTNHDAGNHNGGQIMFGPEGLLYVTIGDDNDHPNAQNPLNDFGKVLRIDPRDPDGSGPGTYSVPASNPTFPEDIHSALYSIGLRNPYRASFGPNGELVVADVGEGTWEEVDVGRPTGEGHATTLWGANLGWPECEGFCNPPDPKFTEPVFEYPHSGASEEKTGCAILGGYVVRDPRLTGLTGRYLYGDLCRKDLRTLNLSVPGADPQPAGLSIPSGELRGFGEDSRGCVYVETTGNVYRVAPSPDAGTACPPPPPPPPSAAAPTQLHLKLKGGMEKLRRHVSVVATCDEVCNLRGIGGVRLSKPHRRASSSSRHCDPRACPPPALSMTTIRAPAGTPVTLHMKMGKRVYRHARRARKAGATVWAEIEVTASDDSGNTTVGKTSIVLR